MGADIFARHFHFFCCCPDHLGGAVANLDYVDKGASNIDTFPLPNANRSMISAWKAKVSALLPAVANVAQ